MMQIDKFRDGNRIVPTASSVDFFPLKGAVVWSPETIVTWLFVMLRRSLSSRFRRDRTDRSSSKPLDWAGASLRTERSVDGGRPLTVEPIGDFPLAGVGMKLIRRLVVVSILLLAGGAGTVSGNSQTTFDLDSTKSSYPFVMRLQGTTTVDGDAIVVEVRGGVIRSAVPTNLGEIGVVRDIRIVFGLGEKTAQGWTTTHDTPAQIIAPSLSPGETRPVAPMRFVISGIRNIPLRDRWLAASLGVTQRLPGIQPGLLWSYACADDNLLGATEASRERAKLMRTLYSRTC